MADRAANIPIAREGIPFVVATGAATAVVWLVGGPVAAGVMGGLTLFTTWFFRNPARTIPQVPRGVVAPGDGRVVGLEEEYEPRYLKDRAIRISIFLNVFDVHVNRIPCAGTVEQVVYQPGQFHAANQADATVHNEQNALMIRTAEGRRVLCAQVAGLIARRIVCWVTPGETVACGERFGLIRFGSRMDLFLPLGTELKVALRDRVKGGESLVGVLPA